MSQGRGGRRALGIGAGLGAAYLATALATAALTGGPVRPLFDGFAPPAPYRWVNPPPEFASGNRSPGDARAETSLGANGSVATTVQTGDGQALLVLNEGSIAARAGDTSVVVDLRPTDPGRLAPLPDGLAAQSNAYSVTIAYRPSGQRVEGLAVTGTVALTSSGPADVLLYSADGQAWERRAAQPFGDAGHGRFAPLATTGYFVVGGAGGAAGEGRGGGSVVLWAVVGIVPLALLVLLLPRRGGKRRRRPPTGLGRGPRSPRRPR
ncbi:MAG: hypothetical protein ACRD0F_04050 [Acidimicrobiales bacterium]